MHKELIIKAFEKAKKDTGSEKLTRLSNYLSDYIQEDSGEVYGEKSLRVNYNLAKTYKDKHIELRSYVVEALSHYLDYENYLDFLNENSANKTNIKSNHFSSSIKTWLGKNKVTIIVGILIIIVFSFTIAITKQRWMVWNEDYYIEVKFDTEKYTTGLLKLYNEDKIKHFKKIPANCNSNFFNPDGTVNIWYGKNINGDLEYFTSLGKHPETGETLKSITEYMITKHICEEFKDN